MLASIRDAGSSITSLTFSAPSSEYPLPRTCDRCVLEFLGQLPSLVRFQSSSNLPFEFYAHLAALPKLRSASLNIENYWQDDLIYCPPDSPHPISLNNLHALRLVARESEHLMPFISRTSLSAIEDIEVRVFFGNGDDLHQFLSYLVVNCTSDRLLSLVLPLDIAARHDWFIHEFFDAEYEFAEPEVFEILFAGDLQPLLSFQNLRHLTVDIRHSLQLSDDILDQMARSWPFLETLRLNPTYGWRGNSQCTWVGIISLLTHCSKLQEIALALRSAEGCSIDMIPSGLTRHRYLRHADFLDTPMIWPSTRKVAHFLYQLSPSLRNGRVHAWGREIRGGNNKRQLYIMSWDHVQSCLIHQ